MTKIINFYCGPSGGKSTSAAYFFYLLKEKRYSVELVQEYVKTWAWEKRTISDLDQFYFLGKQARKEFSLFDKVDTIVTDCPVALSGYYGEKYCTPTVSQGVNAAVLSYYESCKEKDHEHIHIFLTREKAYDPKGRYQTEEARAMDNEILDFLIKNKFNVLYSKSDKKSLEDVDILIKIVEK